MWKKRLMKDGKHANQKFFHCLFQENNDKGKKDKWIPPTKLFPTYTHSRKLKKCIIFCLFQFYPHIYTNKYYSYITYYILYSISTNKLMSIFMYILTSWQHVTCIDIYFLNKTWINILILYLTLIYYIINNQFMIRDI